MAETLDQRVAQAVHETRLLERALHDASARWSMRWRGHEVPAERVVSDSGVTFYASFPALDDTGEKGIWLVLNGVEVRYRDLDLVHRAALDMDWALSLDQTAATPAP